MLKKSVPFMAAISLVLVTGVACTKANSGDGGPIGSSVAQPAPRLADTNVYTPGVAAHTWDIVANTVYTTDAAGVATNEELAPILAAFPTLGDDVALLSTAHLAVTTTDSHIELYNAGELVMVLSVTDSAAAVVWAKEEFSSESIAFKSEAIDQKAMSGELVFNLKACTVPEKTEQGQDKGQSQDKGQDKGQVVDPVCKTIAVKIDMLEQLPKQEPKQDQSQDKGQDKGQDVGQIKK